MKLPRLSHDPSALLGFFQEGLESLGALCERSWHDRLQLVAEGPAARLWNADGALYETELHFTAPGESGARVADQEIFPGCPLTFHLAESLRPTPLPFERAVIASADPPKPPALEVAEKLWHAQRPGCTRWRLESPFVAAHHFSLLLLARCEIQAIDQHWSLHRIALSLPDGQADEALAGGLDFLQLTADSGAPMDWPDPDPAVWRPLFHRALEDELGDELAAIRRRQENYLRRELERIDGYFDGYERELTGRRPRLAAARIKIEERLAAARTEHARRRQDQVHRHEIRVIPHLDALVVLAESAWRATVSCFREREACAQSAWLVPRARKWIVPSSG